ncbi:MAG TPA: acetate--CoA ligase family protein [Solirubrobacteraceae bacterium]|nr:acetate--CoA ligase family protein [Solirubrobacteraceae bacterium]
MTAPGNRDVRAIVAPRSLVLVGASPRRPAPVLGSCRGGIPVWGVNPNRDEVLGVRCVPTIADLPEPVETAVLLVGHERLEGALDEAIEAGIRNFIVPGLGNEAGAAAGPVVRRVTQRVAAAGATMLGPNCMGIAVPDGASPWLAPINDGFIGGHVAAVVQSGSVGEALASLGPRVGFRAVVSCGGEADLGIEDFVDFFAGDERTRAVALFVEAVRHPQAFARALDRCARQRKPVVCLKVGSSDAAARAALAHTGAIVGSRSAFSALLHRTGAIECRDLPELVETLEVLGRDRWPRGTRVGGVSESGGEAALLADRGEDAGLAFEPLAESVRAVVSREFPALTAPGNPIDAWAAAEPERIYPRTLELLAQSGDFDVLVAQIDLSRFRGGGDQSWNRVVVQALGEVANRHDLFGAVTTVHTTDPPAWAVGLARELDIALLRGPRDATAAIARVARWHPRPCRWPSWGEPIAVSELEGAAGALPEYESSVLLGRYGVSFAPCRRARTPANAAAAARELGPPVVVKRDGPAHKARDGGVRLGVQTAAAAAAAARELGGPVLVAQQSPPGEELFCGAIRDPQYGPLIAIGRGGTDVERHAAAVTVLGPIGRDDAAMFVADAGLPDPDGALAAATEAVSRLMHEHPEVAEVDVNPLICSPGGTVAVDALVVVDRTGSAPLATGADDSRAASPEATLSGRAIVR